LTNAEIRRLGYQVVDLLADQLADRSIPAMRRGDPHESLRPYPRRRARPANGDGRV